MYHFYTVSIENRARRHEAERERRRLALIELVKADKTLRKASMLPWLAGLWRGLRMRRQRAGTVAAARVTQS